MPQNLRASIAFLVFLALTVPSAPGAEVASTDSRLFVSTDSVAAAPDKAALERTVRAAVAPFVAKGKYVGLVVGVFDRGTSVIVSYGRKNKDAPGAPDSRTLFEIGSVTKVFTATVLAILVDRGEVHLDDSVNTLLPPPMAMPPAVAGDLTLLHLATHTSGLPRVPASLIASGPTDDPYSQYSPRDLSRCLASVELESRPGATYSYSNLGVGLLGFLLAQKEKTSYESLVTALVSKPLGMNDTCITLSDDQNSRLAAGHTVTTILPSVSIFAKTSSWHFTDCFAGAGALRSTADDMLRFVAASLGYGDSPLVPLLKRTHEPRFEVRDSLHIGLAWHISGKAPAEEVVVWHNGATGGYYSYVALREKSGLGVVVLTNCTTGVEPIGAAVTNAVLASRPKTD